MPFSLRWAGIVLAASALALFAWADAGIPRWWFVIVFAGLAGLYELSLIRREQHRRMRPHLAPLGLLLMSARYTVPSGSIGAGLMVTGALLLLASLD